jgi:hypothetical protein
MQPRVSCRSSINYNMNNPAHLNPVSQTTQSRRIPSAYFIMPYCSTCGVRFKGQGTHCLLHSNSWRHTNTRLQDAYNYNSDSTNSSGVRFRTGVSRPRARFADTHDRYNDTANGLVPYSNHAHTTQRYNVNTSLAQPLVSTFETLSQDHAISSLTYSISPQGDHSLSARANFEREQCTICREWFPDQQRLECHQHEFPVGCGQHGVCLRQEDVQWHGNRERHERCFVRGCGSIYRKEGGWKGVVVERHVREWHC